MSNKNRFPFRLARRTEGAAAVEFALVLSLLLVLVTGMIDFGHAWFIRQITTNASREGARLGVVYQVPAKTNAEIEAAVRNYLAAAGLSDPAVSTVQVTGAGGASGTQLIVVVNSIKNWWIINTFIPGLGEEIQISATTSMRME